MSSAVDNNLSQGKIVEIISSILTAETRTVYVFHLKTTLPLEDFTHVVGLWLQSKLLQQTSLIYKLVIRCSLHQCPVLFSVSVETKTLCCQTKGSKPFPNPSRTQRDSSGRPACDQHRAHVSSVFVNKCLYKEKHSCAPTRCETTCFFTSFVQ